jgi:ketosteroid isomerase-like protein
MRARRCAAIVVCLLGSWQCPAHAQDSPDAATIRELEAKWAESYRNRQVDVLSSLLADDYVITFEDGSVHSKVGLISHTAQPAEHVIISEFSDLKVRMHGATAVVTGNYHEQGTSGGKSYEYNDRLTDVWMKADGKWKLIVSHYSIPSR